MRSCEMRIRLVYQRAQELRRAREKRRLYASASVSVCLCIALILAVRQSDLHAVIGTGGTYAGSSLLSDSIGGYVLVGVVCFMLGVVITVLIRKYLICQKASGSDTQEQDDPKQ